MSREPSENWPPKKTFFVKGQYWFINITIVLLPLPLPHTYTYHRMKVFGHISSDVLQAYTSHAHTHFRRKQHIIISCTESRPRPSSAYSKCTNCMRSSGVGGWSREHSYCIFQPWPLGFSCWRRTLCERSILSEESGACSVPRWKIPFSLHWFTV